MNNSEEARVLGGPLATVELSTLVTNISSHAVAGVRDVIELEESEPDEQKKQKLLTSLHETRQRLLRLLVLVQWSNKTKAVLEVSNVLEKAATYGSTLRDAADQLYHQHNDPALIRAPPFDVPTALDVLQNGGYNLLPSVIEETFRGDAKVTTSRKEAAIQMMDQILRTKLLQENLPAGLWLEEVRDGAAEMRNQDDFTIKLIVVPGPPLPSQTDVAPTENGSNVTLAANLGSRQETTGQESSMQPMEIDNQGDVLRHGGTGIQDGSGDVDPTDRWRWRISSFELLPGTTAKKWLTPRQAGYLQENLDQMMWEAADNLEGFHSQPNGNEEDHQPGNVPSTPSLPEASDGTSVGASQALDQSLTVPQPAGEAVKPLDLMQQVLRSSAHRLVVLEAMRWASKQVQDASQRWHGLIKREKAQDLLGGRILYWPEVSILNPQEVALIKQGASLHDLQTPLAGITSHQPALALGLDPKSSLQCSHTPPLQETDRLGVLGPVVKLKVVKHTADLEGALLQAASYNADLQLGAIMTRLKQVGEIEANEGELVFHPCQGQTNAVNPGSLRNFSSGLLELKCSGKSSLKISMKLTTGQILLRAGNSVQDNGEVATHIRNEEQRIFKMQQSQPPRNFHASAGVFVLNQICEALGKLYIQLSLRQHFIAQASRLSSFGLIQVPVPQRLFKAFHEENPWAPPSKKHVLGFAFPEVTPIMQELPAGARGFRNSPRATGAQKSSQTPSPANSLPFRGVDSASLRSPSGFPSMNSPALTPQTAPSLGLPGAPMNGAPPFTRQPAQPAASVASGPQTPPPASLTAALGPCGVGLQFMLFCELKAGMTWQYSLLILSCNAIGQPVKILQLRRLTSMTSSPQVKRQASNKRKRDDEGGEEQLQEGTTPINQEFVDSSEHAVRQAASCSILEQLALHLQIAGLGFRRCLRFGNKRQRLDCLPTILSPDTPAEDFGAAFAGVNGSRQASFVTTENAETSCDLDLNEKFGRSLVLTSFPGQEALQSMHLDGTVPKAEFVVWRAPTQMARSGMFTLKVESAHLAKASLPPSPKDSRMFKSGARLSHFETGISLTYSSDSGVSAMRALADLQAVIQTTTVYQKLKISCNAAASLPSQGMLCHEGDTGKVSISMLSPTSIRFSVYAPSDSQPMGRSNGRADYSMSVEVHKPRTPPTVFDTNNEAMPDWQSRVSQLPSDGFGDPLRMDTTDLEAFRRRQSIIAPQTDASEDKTGPEAVSETHNSEQRQYSKLPAICIIASWDTYGQSESEASSSDGLHLSRQSSQADQAQQQFLMLKPNGCKLTAEPNLPAPVLRAWEKLLGEEQGVEKLLDAISEHSQTISDICEMLSLRQLGEHGIDASDVHAEWDGWRHVMLVILQDTGPSVCVDVGLAVSGMVWLSNRNWLPSQSTSPPTKASEIWAKVLASVQHQDSIYDEGGALLKDKCSQEEVCLRGIWFSSRFVRSVLGLLLEHSRTSSVKKET